MKKNVFCIGGLLYLGLVSACGVALPVYSDAGGSSASAASATTNSKPAPKASPSPSSTPQKPTPSATTAPTAPANSWQAQYAFRGRFDFADAKGPRFAWPGSAIGANFSGTSLTVLLAEPVNELYNGAPVDNTYDVTIDQQPPVVVQVNHNTTTYPVSTTLAAGNHVVWISKRTEANIGPGQFLGLQLGSGKLLPPPAAMPHTIEFVGDSASSGYGADGNYPVWNGCTFSVDTADADVAYPKVTADLLSAQGVNLAFAGKGVTRNLSDADPVNTVPVIYDYVEPMALTLKYDFSQYVADVVVINIGGNDWTGASNSGTPPDETLFISKYMGLLQDIRKHYPKAVILVALTALAHDNDRVTLRKYTQDVQATAAQTMSGIYYFEFTEYNGELGFGCDAHPDAPAHAVMAQQLATEIKTRMGW